MSKRIETDAPKVGARKPVAPAYDSSSYRKLTKVRRDRSEIQIGAYLKHARLSKGLKLKALASKVGCTEGFLSKVEHNKVQPSLATLHRVVVALDINIAMLFSRDQLAFGPATVARAGTRPTIRTHMRRGPGVALEQLVSNSLSILLEANIHHVDPGGSSDGFIRHEGEEIGYVLQGEMELTVDGASYMLGEGDSFFFKSTLDHGYRNAGDTPLSVLWINTPPTF
jgi:transcriptional regulator with XRE-family HTH domain